MTRPLTRRAFLATTTGAAVGLAGCLSTAPGSRPSTPSPDHSLFVGAFHWGFVMLTGDGTRHTSVTVSEGDIVRFVAFNMEAEAAISKLPQVVRSNLPDHEKLEEANDADIPTPPSGTLAQKRAEANAKYPDHSVALVPSGGMMGGGGMGRGGMMFHPLFLAHDATTPVEVTVQAVVADEYSLECLTYCGYGHPYMDLDDAVTVN